MTVEQLIQFIERRMSMSHIYQPLLIRTLLDAGGTATLRQTAIAFVAQDESLIIEAEKTIVRMPIPVLQKHGVVDYEQTSRLLKLNVPILGLQERAKLRMLCDQRLGEYLAARGMSIWDYRLIDDSAVSYDLRYQVLAESDRRCALCGATEKDRPLDVDHIIPRSRGGRTEKANLQVLCSRCNRAKGNRDTRDFRTPIPETDPECPFCPQATAERELEGTELALAMRDLYPVTEGHTLVIPRRHVIDGLSMTEAERRDVNKLVTILSRRLRSDDPTIEGFNIGENAGAVAGQTVMHAHTHLIPRRQGDVADPAGGIRGVVPGQARYS
jgi:diadenosine tetraphosphate (Ap4A) HIT family hydrolase